MIRILLMEDDIDFCYLICYAIEKEADMQIVSMCHTCEEALRQIKQQNADIALCDLSLQSNELDGIQAARSLRLLSDAKVIILSAYEDSDIVMKSCKESFASCYIFKSQFEQLITSIRKTAQGPTPQAYMIRDAILSQLSSAEMAVFHMMMGEHIDLQSSAKTISNQKTSILHKLGLKNQKELQHIFHTYE